MYGPVIGGGELVKLVALEPEDDVMDVCCGELIKLGNGPVYG